MTWRGRRIAWWGRSVIALAVLLAAIAGLYVWATRTGSVATLDFVDSLFTQARDRVHVRYGKLPSQQLFVYPGRGAEKLPVVVFVHGGGWVHGSPADYGFVARNIAPHGYAVVLAGYRLGPEGRFPAMLEDTAAAVAWTRAHAAEYGGDPDRILLMGHSAGAYNVAMVALDKKWLAAQQLDTHFIKGVIGLSGPYDFYPFKGEAERKAFAGWPQPKDTQPVNFARGDAPPMLLINGADDDVVRPRNALALGRALTAAGAQNVPGIFPGLDHSQVLMDLARPFDRDPRVKSAVVAFLAESTVLPPTSAPVQPAKR